MEDAFGESLPSPWRNLTLGLALGGEALFERVRDLVGKKGGAAGTPVGDARR